MFELILGLLLIVFCFATAFIFRSIIAYIVGLITVVIGLYMFIKGFIKIIKNRNTAKKGEECFAMVEGVSETGRLSDGKPIYKASFIVYVDSLVDTRRVYETIGVNPSKYPLGCFVKVKYYEGDINILHIVYDESVISDEIKQKIKNDVTPVQNEVIVDGDRYIGWLDVKVFRC